MVPEFLAHACDTAVLTEPDTGIAAAKNPDARGIDARFMQRGKMFAPEIRIECAADIIPVVPRRICAAKPERFAVNLKMSVRNGNARFAVRLHQFHRRKRFLSL